VPIKDLLWACPICHQIEAIGRDGRCRACGAQFTRGRGARIRATTPEGSEEQHPLDWLAQFPWPDLDGTGRSLPAGLEPPFRQVAQVRLAFTQLPLRRGHAFLGMIEKLGPVREGQLELTDALIGFMPPRSGDGWSWPLIQITAIQPSSSAIQLKARERPVASIRFTDGSVRLWEQRLQYCVRRAYERAGQGEVLEFQPHIRTR